MKKLFIVVICCIYSLLVTGCTPKEEVDINIIVPNGITTFAFMNMLHEETELGDNTNVKYDIVNGPEPLVSAFTSESHDIIVAPTNLGAKMFNSDIKYKLGATFSWGNLYLVSKTDLSKEDLAGKTIYAFGQNSTPDIILQSVLEANGLTDVNIEYFNSISDITPLLLSGKAEVALLAEPVYTVAKGKATLYTVVDLQEEWKSVSGNEQYPQASVFISEKLINKRKDVVDKFLEEFEKSINFVNENTKTAGEYVEAYDTKNDGVINFPKSIVEQSIPNGNLKFISAEEAKQFIESYLTEIKNFNDKLIGGKLPDNDFYYSK